MAGGKYSIPLCKIGRLNSSIKSIRYNTLIESLLKNMIFILNPNPLSLNFYESLSFNMVSKLGLK